MFKKGVAILGFLGFSLSYASTVWFPVENSNSNVPSMWQNGFLQGYKLGYAYCMLDTQSLKDYKEKLLALNLLIERLSKIQSGKNVKVENKSDYVEITLKIPKNMPSLIRLAKYVKSLEKAKLLKGWVVYLDGSDIDEVKLGWYIYQASKIGLNPLKIGKVIIFDTEPTKPDAEYIAQKLNQIGIYGIKVAYIQ